MTPRSALCLLLPGALLYSCVLPSFENVPRREEPVGGAINNQGGEGNQPGAGGSDGTSGASDGGSGNSGAEPQPEPDTYVLQQGDTLTVLARDGVLANDAPDGLSVTLVEVDPALPAGFAGELDIGADGSFTFTPVADFFGRYVATYTAETEAGVSATASVTFVVQPTVAGLDAVAAGAGGVLLTGSSGEELGAALTALGDVNDDGFDDFAVGAPGAASSAGAVYVVFGSAAFESLTLGALSTSSKETRFAVLEGSDEASIGREIASAGAFDSDPVRDILIGSPTATPAGGSAGDGQIFVVYGGAELRTSLTLPGMPAERGIAILGTSFTGQRLGAPVAGGGDFDGDQKVDLLAGLFEAGNTTKGACVIMENPVDDVAIEVTNHATIEDGLSDLPLSLSFAGDMNDDGKDDLIASSERHIVLVLGDGNGTLPATVASVSVDGSAGGYKLQRANNATGIAPVATAGDANGDGKADLAYCDRLGSIPTCVLLFGNLTPGSQLAPGDWQLTGFGAAPPLPLLSPGADVNQDGFDDVLLADEGSIYVVFGRDSGFEAGVDVSSLGDDGFAITAPSDGTIGAMAAIGDVNGDGYVDFAAGDPSAAANSGRVYVVFGGPYAAGQR